MATWSCSWVATLEYNQSTWTKRLTEDSLFKPPPKPTLADFSADFDSIPLSQVTDADIVMTPQWFGILVELLYFFATFCALLSPAYFFLRPGLTDRLLHVILVTSACCSIVTVPSTVLILLTGSIGGPHLFILAFPVIAFGLITGFATMPSVSESSTALIG
jgi:hypothetical protein